MKDRIKWGVLLAVCLLLVIGNVRTYAQQDMGRIISVPVVNAWTLKEISDSLKVEILSPKDSSLVFTFESGTMTEKFPTQWYGPFLMRVTHPHYYPVLKRITVYKKKMSVILDKVELTPITKLTEQRLGEATVSATRVQMVMKGDTVVYDARAFQTAEGSMLEELIEQLPGVRLDDNGRITLNGKFVSSLLLNGKDFFRGDPTVALRNLPAYMVDKVKGYERTPPKGLSSRSEVRGNGARRAAEARVLARIHRQHGLGRRYARPLRRPALRPLLYGPLARLALRQAEQRERHAPPGAQRQLGADGLGGRADGAEGGRRGLHVRLGPELRALGQRALLALRHGLSRVDERGDLPACRDGLRPRAAQLAQPLHELERGCRYVVGRVGTG